MDDFFSIKDKKIILYGAASMGRRYLPVFKDEGYYIEGFIDKRASEIKEFLGYPVFDINDESIVRFINDNYVVFVSVKNVFEHTVIANMLVKRGFNNIIYRPIDAIDGTADETHLEMNSIYDKIENGMISEVDMVRVTKSLFVRKPKNSTIIFEDDTYIIAYVSIDCIFTDAKERKTPWFDKPVVAELPHIDLFRFISGNANYDIHRYLDFCVESAKISEDIVISDAWKANVLKNRSSVYEHMNQSYELDFDFFVRNAPLVSWNEKGYFNLNSGKHRAAFFASKYCKYMPVKVGKVDYQKFLNYDAVVKIFEIMERHEISSLKSPISTPYLYNYDNEGREFYYNLWYCLSYYISSKLYDSTRKLEFDEVNLLCDLDDLAFIESALLRSGCSVSVFKSYEDEEELIKAVYELHKVRPAAEKKCYDYAIIDITKSEEILNRVLDLQIGTILVMVDSNNNLCKSKNFKRLFSSIRGGEKIVFGEIIK